MQIIDLIRKDIARVQGNLDLLVTHINDESIGRLGGYKQARLLVTLNDLVTDLTTNYTTPLSEMVKPAA